MKRNEWFSVLKHLSYLTQLGLSVLSPILICMVIAWWVTSKFHVGQGVYIPAIILGIGGGISAFASFAKYVINNSKKGEDK